MSIDEFRQKWREVRLRRWIMRCILAEAFFVALVPEIAATALVIGFILTLVKLKTIPRAKLRSLPFDVPVIIFIVLAALSVIRSPDHGFSFYNYYHLVGAYGLTYFLIGQNVYKTNQVQKIAAALAAAAGLVVLYGFYQFAFGVDIAAMRWTDDAAFPEIDNRVFSTWENPNILAGYLDTMIALALGALTFAVNKSQRVTLAVIILLLASCLAMTYARGAILTLAIMLFVYGFYHDWRVPALGGLIGLAAVYLNPTLADRLTSVVAATQDTSAEMRWAFWEATWAMIQDHPFLGIGWGAYWLVYPAYDFYLQGAKIIIYHAHNIYLNYAAEIGIPGAMAFFWFFFGTMNLAFKTELAEKSRDVATPTPEEPSLSWGEKLLALTEKFRPTPAAPDAPAPQQTAVKPKATKPKRKFKIYKLVKITKLAPAADVQPAEPPAEISGAELLKKLSEEIRAPAPQPVDTTPAEPDKNTLWHRYLGELSAIEPIRVCAAMSLGIGLAILGMALNGFTDDLLFNFPTSLLLWLLAALAAVNVSIEDDPKYAKRNEAWL